jgi:hypothetical protein
MLSILGVWPFVSHPREQLAAQAGLDVPSLALHNTEVPEEI